jgi:hypothetical protein
LSAFDDDCGFEQHLSEPNWSFKFATMPKVVRDSIEALFKQFYDHFVGDGFNDQVHGTGNLTLSREYYMKCYACANPQLAICPVCDKEAERHPDTNVFLLTIDHYFSQSEFPFLTLHPANLVPACHNCNTTFKLAKSVLYDEATNGIPTDALNNVYHAYHGRAILNLDSLCAYRDRPQANLLCIEITNSTGTSARRIAAANRVFRLTARWQNRLSNNIRPRLIAELICQAHESKSRDKADLLRVLRTKRAECEPGANSYDVVKIAYLDYAISDATETEYLLKTYAGDI